MSEKLVVRIEDLRLLSQKINDDKKEVEDLYNNRIKKLIIESEDCLKSHGVTKEKELEIFEKLIAKYKESSSSLVEVLDSKIIPNYEELRSELNVLFSKEFLLKLEELLNTKE